MEFLVLASGFVKQPERERVILEAVIEAAEEIGADRIVKRRGNVYSTGVYITDGKTKSLLYNDWDKDWDRKKIYENIMASIRFSPVLSQRYSDNLVISYNRID
jgi:hypothetical protein